MDAARDMDNLLGQLLETVTGTEIPLEGGGEDVITLDPGIRSLQGKTYQWWLAQLPIKAGGLGIQNQVSLSRIAFLGSVELCLPSFCGPGGTCRSLSYLVDSIDT